jgi:hypothetical protein
MPDADLDVALQNPDAFLLRLRTKTQRNRWLEVSFSWWGNVLGLHRLSENAGQFMRGAKRGTGLLITGFTKRGESLSNKLDQIIGAVKDADAGEAEGERIEDGRVAVANHRATFWCNTWDYSTGADPRADGDEDENDQAERIAAEHQRGGRNSEE